jgi:hypothetical protein
MRAAPPVILLALLAATAAHAEVDAAPTQATRAAHTVASQAGDALVRALPPLPAQDRERLVGLYVAFQADARDPLALAACDDDGDPVVVLSDAMLTLLDGAARALASDELLGTHALRDYGALLAAEQRPGERLLPPPPAPHADLPRMSKELAERQSSHFRAMVAMLIAHEMAHLSSGDLVCPRPTATHEAGDDTWTPQEHAAALRARGGHDDPRRRLAADVTGTAYAVGAGVREEPLAELLVRVMAEVERSPRALAAFTYARTHAASTVRAQVLRAAAAAARARPATVR